MRAFLPVVVSTVVVGGGVLVGACGSAQGSRPFVGTLPRDTQLDMAGAFTFSADGELRLALVKPCTAIRNEKTSVALVEDSCTRAQLDRIRVVAHTPWNQDLRGTWLDAGHLVFRADWKATGLEPLADDAPAVGARPWVVSGTQWAPSAAQTQAILKRIGDATETETDLVRGGPPPSLDVTGFEIEGEMFHAGAPSTLVVKIANHGTGAAYRVVATTRSSIAVLHGRRFAFGMIKPGAEKVRKLELTIPGTETAHDTMLVLLVAEGNGAAPHNVSHRMAIAASTAAPVLGVQCTVEGKKLVRPDLDAGQTLKLRCQIDNTGNADARAVELEASVAGGPPGRSAPQAIAAAGHLVFNVPIIVPRTLPIDAPVEIAITARDRPSSRSARATVVGVVRKPKLCVPGQLTNAQYQAKIADLKAALSVKALTQDEYDRYDAELVACLK
jgi:hypothetical protein